MKKRKKRARKRADSSRLHPDDVSLLVASVRRLRQEKRESIERASARILLGIIELGCVTIGDFETENLLLEALDLPVKRPGESHEAWRRRNGIK